MLEAGQAGVVWDLETLGKFVTKPRSVVNGSNMSFTGLRNADDVAIVIAYLATFSPPPHDRRSRLRWAGQLRRGEG